MEVTVGADFKVREISIAAVVCGGGITSLVADTKRVPNGQTIPNTLLGLGGRTEALMEHVLLLAQATVSDIRVAMVEEPGSFPHRPHPHLVMAQGIIMAALAGMGITVVSYPVTSWKKETVGKGNATKAEVQQYIEDKYNVTLGQEDEYDAAAIADCAMKTSSP